MTEQQEQKERQEGLDSKDALHLSRSEADLLGVEREGKPRDPSRDPAYPSDLPEGGALTEDMVVELLVGDQDEDSREDVEEAIADSMEQGAEDDPA